MLDTVVRKFQMMILHLVCYSQHAVVEGNSQHANSSRLGTSQPLVSHSHIHVVYEVKHKVVNRDIFQDLCDNRVFSTALYAPLVLMY